MWFLAHLSAIERSPNTVRAYAHDLRDFFEFVAGRDVGWDRVRLKELTGLLTACGTLRDRLLLTLLREAGVPPHSTSPSATRRRDGPCARRPSCGIRSYRRAPRTSRRRPRTRGGDRTEQPVDEPLATEPTHRSLEHIGQVGPLDIRRHLDASPYRRLHLPQRHLQPMHGLCSRRPISSTDLAADTEVSRDTIEEPVATN